MNYNKIKKLSRLEKLSIRGLIKQHKKYLRNIKNNECDIKKDLEILLQGQAFQGSFKFSNFLKTSLPQNLSKSQVKMSDFFKCTEVKNNHYIQRALIKRNLIDSENDFKYINYAQYLNHFQNLAQNSTSDESKILKNLKLSTPTGIEDYVTKLVANFTNTKIKNQNNINKVDNNPMTYFISVFTENMINTNNIEDKFIKCLDNKELYRYDIIKYLALHYSRNSYHFLSTIRVFLRIFKVDCNNIDFEMYCAMKYAYHLVTMTVYVKSLRFFLKNNKKLDFHIKDISTENNVAFSDSIANTIPHLGFSSLLLDSKFALIINKKNIVVNNKSLFETNIFSALEWIVIKKNAVSSLLNNVNFPDWLKNNFCSNVYPNYDVNIKSLIDINKNQQDLNYLLYSFKIKAKIFEV